MKLLQKLDLFKISILVILVILILVLNNMSKNGRYMYATEGMIIDTRIGNMYTTDSHDVKDSWYFKPILPKDHK